MTSKQTHQINPSIEFIAGYIAGFGKVYIGQPFDAVKVRMQALQGKASQTATQMMIVRQIYQDGGLKSFWKGSVPPLLGIGATVSIQFSVNETVKKFFAERRGSKRLSFHEYYIGGFLAGFFNSVGSIPVEHIRIRMQTQPIGNKLYRGSLDCFQHFYRNHGIRGVYHGGVITTIRDSIAYGSYFSSFGMMIDANLNPGENKRDLSYAAIALWGSLAGVAMWTSSYPFDVIKTKIQADSMVNPMYKGWFDCAVKVYKADGIKAFFRGFWPCMARALPVNGGVFTIYEFIARELYARNANKKLEFA